MSLAEIPGGLLGIAAAICLAPLMGVNGLIIGSIIGLLIQTVVSTLQARHWLKEASPNHAN